MTAEPIDPLTDKELTNIRANLARAERSVDPWAVVSNYRAVRGLVAEVDRLKERLATAEKELAAAHFALDVDGWRVEHGDCLVDLYHEFSDFPMLTEVKDLGAILAFIAECNEGADTARALGRDGEGQA